MVYLLAFHKSNTAIGKQTIFKLIRYLNNKQISHYYTAMHIVCSCLLYTSDAADDC